MSRPASLLIFVCILAISFGAWEMREARMQREKAEGLTRDKAALERQVESLGKAQVLLTEERDRLTHALESEKARTGTGPDTELKDALVEANARIARTADALRQALNVPVALTAHAVPRTDGVISYGITFSWDPVAPPGSVLAIWRGTLCRTPADFSPSDLIASQAADRETQFTFVRGDLVPGTEVCAQVWRNWTHSAERASNPLSVIIQP